ncbi:MAG: SbcC/MukB-like Walker B domain-containing protein, partial [Actinomycetota bacterium]
GESLDLRAERDDARIVFRTCNGDAGMGVKLERWVLAAELERVTQAANVHLARMSNGRFRLGRKEGKVTLDIEVFDSNTGRARATSSLSGGEQFQASLSLALGLADVVSHGGTASGRTFEALFVDEGFGSLDPKALDQAIEALLMIQAGGRMVGAITHVEGMKERLHTGIEVSARADGRGSTLKVNP